MAGVGALGQVRRRAAAPQGPPRPRLLRRTHPRGGDHRHRAPRGHLVAPPPSQHVPDPDQVQRRDPAALRAHARARVHHEGRVLLPRRRRRPRPRLPGDGDGLPAGFRALWAGLHPGRGRHRQHRRLRVPRVHGPGRDRRGRDSVLPLVRLRRQRREGRHRPGRAGARVAARPTRTPRARSTPPRCARSKRSRPSSASRLRT